MRIRVLLIVLAVIVLAGCTGPQPEPSSLPTPEASSSPTPAPLTLTVEAIADPSLMAADIANPFDEINPYLANIYSPNETLYNALYRAVATLEPTFDASGYDLTYEEKYHSAECLFGESGFRFYYFKNFKLSKDGNTFTFIYNDTTDAARNMETFCARLGQLLYNTAPENGTDIQKFMAVYQYICETANYSSDMSDYSTCTPYSILMNGQGICNGYATLLEYTLRHLGIPAEYVSNEPHAWNIVQLDGEWYQTDLTWGAGNAGDWMNNTYTLLIDNATRLQTLNDSGYNIGDIHVGYPGSDMGPMPACTSTRFSDYRNIGYVYAFDIPSNQVYYSGSDGLSRMNLDGSGKETIAQDVYATQMVYFDGALYYVDMNDGFLYRLVPGGEPEPLDDSDIVAYLGLDGASLSYGLEPGEKTLPLLPFDAADFESADTQMLSAVRFPRSRTFRFDIHFSAPVDASQDWNQLIFLADTAGNPIPLRLELSGDKQTLTVRSAECIADKGPMSLLISDTIVSEQGATLTSPCRMDVSLVSEVEA